MSLSLVLSLLYGATESGTGLLTQPWLYAEVEGRGPSNWHQSYETCGGTQQSPVNIRDADYDWGLQFLDLQYEKMDTVIVQNIQSTLKVKLSGSHSTLTDPNQHNKKYNLDQMHIHTPSEHQIGGGLFDMEVHLVHSEDDHSEEGTPNLVIAIMFSSGSNTYNTWLNKFIKDLPTVPLRSFRHYATVNKDYEFAPHERNHAVSLDPLDIFPGKRDFFTYKGSLTTPPCSEVVTWYVFKEPVTMSVSQLAAIRAALAYEGTDNEQQYVENNYAIVTEGLWGNNRPIQPLNDRVVTQFSYQHVNVTTEHQDDGIKLGVIGTVLGTCILIAVLVGLFIAVRTYCKRPSNKLPQ